MLSPPPQEPRVAPIEHQYGVTDFDSMDPAMSAYFSYSWDVTEAYHKGMISINESSNTLRLRMHEPQAPYGSIFTQCEFINYLQWPNNCPFYYL